MSAPFGTPMIASTESTNFKLAQLSGYDTNSNWKSIIIPTIDGGEAGYIDKVIVRTPALASGARCDLKIEYNQGVSATTAYQITTSGKTLHEFPINLNGVEDLRVYLDWSNSTTVCPIKEIVVKGHFMENG
jgi:hypothetical protein